MIEGLKELKERLSKRKIDAALNRAVHKGGRLFRDEVRTLTPKDSGTLKRSITVIFDRNGINIRATILSDPMKLYSGNIPYDWFVEAGTGIYGPVAGEWLPYEQRFMRFYSRKFNKWIRIRGQRPKWMFRDAYNNKRAEVIQVFQSEISGL